MLFLFLQLFTTVSHGLAVPGLLQIKPARLITGFIFDHQSIFIYTRPTEQHNNETDRQQKKQQKDRKVKLSIFPVCRF